MKRFNLIQEENKPNTSYSSSSNSILKYIPIIVAGLIIYLMHTNNEVNVKSENVELVKKYNLLKKEYNKLSQLKTDEVKTDELFNEKEILNKKLLGLKSLNREKMNFIEFMIQIKDSISEKIAMLNLSKKYTDIKIEGIAQDNLSISEFIQILTNTNLLKNIELKLSEYVNEYGPYKQKFIISGELN